MKSGRIKRIDIYKFDIPLKAPFKIATMTTTVAKNVLFRVETEDGIIGWGESSPLHTINGETQGTVIAAGQEFARFALGREVGEIRTMVDEWEYLIPLQGCSASGLEMAILDAAAQEVEMPLWKYLGGTQREFETDCTIPIVGPDEAAKQAKEILKDGHKSIKVKLGNGINDDVERVDAVREAVGDRATIRVDANQGYLRDDAIKMLDAIAEFDVEFCEQPVAKRDKDGLYAVTAASTIPIMADESIFSPADAMMLIENESCSSFNIKLSKSRGIIRGLEIAAIARTACIPCMVGGMVESLIGATAACHMAAASPVFRWFDLDSNLSHAMNPVIGGANLKRGTRILPTLPGLGAVPDNGFLKTLEVVTLN